MSVNKLISIKNAVLNAQDMLGMDNDTMRPLFTTWATYAEKEIGGCCGITKFCVIDICGCTAELPNDTFQVKGAVLGRHDANCGSLFSNNLLSNASIAHFLVYKYLMRKRKKSSVELREMDWNFREWDRLCAHARADDAILTETEKEEIALMYNDPYAGRGLADGMRINGLNGGYDTVGY